MKVTSVSDRGLIRLISATYHKPPVLRGLADTDDEADILAEIEGMTSGRLCAERGQNPYFDPRELAWQRRKADLRVYGQTHINATFSYTRTGGNRFNDQTRGAWYCAWDVMVSLAEVAFHRTRELSFVGIFDDTARYVEILADFIGDFADLRDEPDHPALNPDPVIGYPEGQKVANQLQHEELPGLIYPSVRARSKGDCLVCFVPNKIQNVRPGASWDLIWRGTPEYSLRQVAS